MTTQRRVLITGAGSGLGQALALRYARAGCRVACVDLSAERADGTRAMLAGSGHLALVANVGNDEAMEQMHEAVVREWGGIDVLINNAGIASGGPMIETTMAEWRQILDIDLLSVVRGRPLFLAGLPRRFAREDIVEQTWRVVQPALDTPGPVHPYFRGSWGPSEANRILQGDSWFQPAE